MPNPIIRRILTPSRKTVYTWDSLPAHLTPVIGTFGVSGGGLRALTAEDVGNNLIANGEFTTDTGGWTALSAALSRVDSEIDPGANSGGLDKWALKAISGGLAYSQGVYAFPVIVGAVYIITTRAFCPSGNVESHNVQLGISQPSQYVAITNEDVWETLTVGAGVARSATPSLIRVLTGTAAGNSDVAYFDKVVIYRQGSLLIDSSWPSPNVDLLDALLLPASGVVPFSRIFRYVDPLNYWSARVLPNTAGTDLQIVEVVAGVETVRASADVDWTANDVDSLWLSVQGPKVTAYVKKSGAAVYTSVASYATMTTGLTARAHGWLGFETGVNRVNQSEVW